MRAPPIPPPPHAPKRVRAHPHRRARLITAGVVLAVAAAIAYAMRPTPMAVDAAPVRVGPMQNTIEVDAVSRVRDHFAIAAPIGGMVQRLTLREGDSVRAGEVVATIVTPPVFATERRALVARVDAARAARLQADARVTQASQALAQAVRDQGRARTLLEAGGIADRDLCGGKRLSLCGSDGERWGGDARTRTGGRARVGDARAQRPRRRAGYAAALGGRSADARDRGRRLE